MIFQHKSQFVRERVPTEAKKKKKLQPATDKEKNRCLIGRLKKPSDR